MGDAIQLDLAPSVLVWPGAWQAILAAALQRAQPALPPLPTPLHTDDEREGRRRGGLGGGKRADYTKPVSFVGGGVVQHGPEESAQQPEQAPQQQGAAGPPPAQRGGLGFAPAGGVSGVGASSGLGFGPAAGPPAAAGGHGGIGFSAGGTAHGGIGLSGDAGGGGLGFSAGGGAGGGGIGFAKGHATLQQEEEEEEEEVLLPTAFGRRIQAAAEQRRKQSEATARVERAKTKAATGPAPKDVGRFEQHTKGIGAKLLSMMGWSEGQGLGRDRKVRAAAARLWNQHAVFLAAAACPGGAAGTNCGCSCCIRHHTTACLTSCSHLPEPLFLPRVCLAGAGLAAGLAGPAGLEHRARIGALLVPICRASPQPLHAYIHEP